MSEMNETRTILLKDIDPSPYQPRCTFDPVEMQDLVNSIKRRGVRQRVLVRPKDKRFELLDGERRCRASEIAGLKDIPAEIRSMSDTEAQELALVLNLQRVSVPPLEESDALAKLLQTRTLDDLAAAVGKSKQEIHQSLALQRLVPEVRAAVQSRALPIAYARKLARVPVGLQKDGLSACFGPLFKDQPCQREHLAPMHFLDEWLRKHVRFNPDGADEAVLFPDIVQQVDRIQKQKKIRILLLSTLHRRADGDRSVLPAQHWRVVDPKKPCPHAKEGIIVLGDQQRQIVLACTAKRECRRHWPADEPPTNAADKQRADARAREEAARNQRKQEHWKTHLRPRALKNLADVASRFRLDRNLATWLVGELTGKEDGFAAIFGVSLAKLPEKQFVAALVVAAATRHTFSYDAFKPVAKRFGLKVPAPSGEPAPVDVAS